MKHWQKRISTASLVSLKFGIIGIFIALIRFLGFVFTLPFADFLLKLFKVSTPLNFAPIDVVIIDLAFGLIAIISGRIALGAIHGHKETLRGRRIAKKGRRLGALTVGLAFANCVFFAFLMHGDGLRKAFGKGTGLNYSQESLSDGWGKDKATEKILRHLKAEDVKELGEKYKKYFK